MISRPTRLLVSALLLFVVTACADSGDPTASTSPSTGQQGGTAKPDDAGGVVVEVRDNSFAPDTADLVVNDTITWDFSTADQPHDVVFDDERGSAMLDEGTWSTSFDEPGTYAYECTLHRGMTGQITVTS